MKTLDVNLLLCRDDKYSEIAVKSLHNTFVVKEGINKFVSVDSSMYEYFCNKYSKYKDIKFLINDSKDCYEHMEKISSKSDADYIMFLHDDDFFGEQLLVKTFSLIQENLPVAISLRPTFINYESKKYTRQRYRYDQRIYKKNKYLTFGSYFLPFIWPVIFPTIAFRNDLLKNYFNKFNSRMGVHEDVRIVLYFVSIGNFIEHKMTDLYFYRWHDHQSANHKDKEGDRLLLINWLKHVRINFIYKLLLVAFAYLQFFVFIKKFNSYNKFFNIFLKIRMKIIYFSRGGNAN